jgi:hypothetical protein
VLDRAKVVSPLSLNVVENLLHELVRADGESSFDRASLLHTLEYERAFSAGFTTCPKHSSEVIFLYVMLLKK